MLAQAISRGVVGVRCGFDAELAAGLHIMWQMFGKKNVPKNFRPDPVRGGQQISIVVDHLFLSHIAEAIIYVDQKAVLGMGGGYFNAPLFFPMVDAKRCLLKYFSGHSLTRILVMVLQTAARKLNLNLAQLTSLGVDGLVIDYQKLDTPARCLLGRTDIAARHGARKVLSHSVLLPTSCNFLLLIIIHILAFCQTS